MATEIDLDDLVQLDSVSYLGSSGYEEEKNQHRKRYGNMRMNGVRCGKRLKMFGGVSAASS